VFADDQRASHVGAVAQWILVVPSLFMMNDCSPPRGSALGLAKISGIRRVGDDLVRESVDVDPAQALARVDDDGSSP
jgi:hypothetical protein